MQSSLKKKVETLKREHIGIFFMQNRLYNTGQDEAASLKHFRNYFE